MGGSGAMSCCHGCARRKSSGEPVVSQAKKSTSHTRFSVRLKESSVCVCVCGGGGGVVEGKGEGGVKSLGRLKITLGVCVDPRWLELNL